MRYPIVFVSAVLALASQASAGTRNFGLESFTKIRVEGPFKVTLATGVAPFARASGSTTALDRIAVEVSDGTLVIRADPSAWGGYPGENPGPVEITIGTHDLTNASLTGAGSLSINHVEGLKFALSVLGSGAAEISDVAADNMDVNLAGTASAKLSGRSLQFTSLVRGLSSLDAANLITSEAHFTAEGSATINASVTKVARIDARGAATIRLSGHPSCTLEVSGSTNVSGCK